MNLAASVHRAAIKHPDWPALFIGARTYASYASLSRTVAKLANGIINKFNCRAGEHVGIVMPNCAQYIELMYAIWHAGMVVVPINSKLHARELAYIFQDAGIRLCFTGGDAASRVNAALQLSDSLNHVLTPDDMEYQALKSSGEMEMRTRKTDDIGWLFYTSGTTGRPKGAMLSIRNLQAMSTSHRKDIDPLERKASLLHLAPLSHGSGLYNIPYCAAGAINVLPESGRFDPDELSCLLDQHANCSFFCAPTMVNRVIDADVDLNLEHMKTIIYGGAPMYAPDCLRALDRLGPRLAQIYGQGESPMTITLLSRQQHADTAHPKYLKRIKSVGQARSLVKIAVVDKNGSPLPAGAAGEIVVKGDTVMQGYLNNPKASASALRGGWLYTGDIGELDDDGFLYLKDRSKDVIISGGMNIYPREVEEVLSKHDLVTEVSVIGEADREWGETVCAYIVQAAGIQIDPQELDTLCLTHLARFKRPRRYRFIDALPRNETGKVLKRLLRETPKLSSQPEQPTDNHSLTGGKTI